MTSFKRIALFYFLGLAIIFLFSLPLNRNQLAAIKEIGIWIVPAIFSLLGWLIGSGIYELMMKPVNKKNRILLITHTISLLCLATLIFTLKYNSWYQKTHLENVDNNHDIMEFFVEDHEEYVRLGFKKLETEFKNPNDFKLDAFSVNKRDTIINNNPDTLYTIHYTYYLTSDKNNKYFSKVSVLAENATLHLFNINVNDNAEYLELKAKHDKTEQEVMQSIKDEFQQMSDTIKKVLSQ